MNLALETAAFLQLALLPGALFLRATGLRTSPLGFLVSAFAFSGLFNYLAVLLLVACGAFCHGAALALLGVELALAAWLWRGSLRPALLSNFGEAASKAAENALSEIKGFVDEAQAPKALACAALASAALAVALALLAFFDSAGSVFDAWDAVLSWNRWASGWLAGSYPEWTNGYPQLVPCNWALAYMIQGDALQFVPKMSVGLYELGLLLAIVDLALLFRSAGLMAAAPVFAWLMRNVEIARFGGDVDVAVTFMGFAAFHLLLRSAKAEDVKSFKLQLLAASLLAAATAATKQAGLFLFVMIVPLAFLLLRERFKSFGFGASAKLKAVLLHLLLAALIAAPCYVCAKYMVMQGRDKYKVKFVTEDIYGGRGYAERAIISSKMLLLRLGLGMHEIPGARWTHVEMDQGLKGIAGFYSPYGALAAAAAALGALLLALGAKSGPLGRWPLLLLAAPLTALWALLYCYDLRNLSSALPYLSLCLGLGLVALLSKPWLWRGWIPLAAALAAIGVLGASSLSETELKKAHEILEMRIGDPRLNAKLYEYREKRPFTAKIATDYEFIDYLPGLKGQLRYVEFSGQTAKEEGFYFQALQDPSVGFMLVPNYTMPSVLADIRKRIETGEMERIFHEFSYMLVKINRKPETPASPEGSPQK